MYLLLWKKKKRSDRTKNERRDARSSLGTTDEMTAMLAFPPLEHVVFSTFSLRRNEFSKRTWRSLKSLALTQRFPRRNEFSKRIWTTTTPATASSCSSWCRG